MRCRYYWRRFRGFSGFFEAVCTSVANIASKLDIISEHEACKNQDSALLVVLQKPIRNKQKAVHDLSHVNLKSSSQLCD